MYETIDRTACRRYHRAWKDASMEYSISNHTYVVTGATSGIGLAVSELLAGQGHSVIGVGRSSDHCRSAAQHLRALPGRVVMLVADLSLQSQVLCASI